jgi:hypothetical protein
MQIVWPSGKILENTDVIYNIYCKYNITYKNISATYKNSAAETAMHFVQRQLHEYYSVSKFLSRRSPKWLMAE